MHPNHRGPLLAGLSVGYARGMEQYAAFLDGRGLTWPEPPDPEKPKAKPHLAKLPGLRAITWNIYGSLLNISTGELLFEHPQPFVMDLALDKTVQEFKMWGSMSRKPGKPSEYMGQIYRGLLSDLRLAASPGEKHPEILAEKIWDGILGKLLKKDYKYDVGFYGPQAEYAKKIAYFFHASLQGTACYPGAAQAVEAVHNSGMLQGLIADGQCFTLLQLQRGLTQQHLGASFHQIFPGAFRSLSCDVKGRKPSERLFRPVLEAFEAKGIKPQQILHIGSRIEKDIAPARKLGMRTALFAGDKGSLQATAEQLKDPASRPDLLITELQQIREIVPDRP